MRRAGGIPVFELSKENKGNPRKVVGFYPGGKR